MGFLLELFHSAWLCGSHGDLIHFMIVAQAFGDCHELRNVVPSWFIAQEGLETDTAHPSGETCVDMGASPCTSEHVESHAPGSPSPDGNVSRGVTP